MADSRMGGKEALIVIHIRGDEQLLRYEQGIRGILRKIEVGKCEPELIENIKAVYELLAQLQLKSKSLQSDCSE
jgi:hypothetical protein